MNPFREFRATDITAHSLQDEMGSRGYLLIRGLLPTEELNRLLGEIAQIVFTAGWLLPDHNPVERMANVSAACGDPDPLFKRTYEQIFSLESLHAFAHHAALRRVMNILVGPHLLIHGTSGTFVKYGMDPQEDRLRGKNPPQGTDWGDDWGEESEEFWGTLSVVGEASAKLRTERGDYRGFYANVRDAIEKKSVLDVSSEQALRTMRALMLAHKSSRLKRTVLWEEEVD